MDVLTLGSQRLIHLDMKGAPPRLSYLDKLFPLLRDWGATGLLIEWEDTFPYTDDLSLLGSRSEHNESIGGFYTIEEVNQIQDLATINSLSVIPLIQTFGHLEFLLKHSKWRSLREVENYPSSMCPSHSDSLPTIRKIITQIIKNHPNIQYIHIGADEVWHMGLCPSCERRVQTCKNGKADLFLEHIMNVAQFIKDHYPNLKIIIWDDMLRNIDTAVLQEYNLGTLVEPMVWHYNPMETFSLGPSLWDKYSNVFPNIWIGTAFKGATGCTQIVPVHRHHISNHETWLAELNSNVNKIQNFRGCAFTGWSRYDHYALLCELLPCALPSLALCLKVWLNGGYNTNLLKSVSKMLGYINVPLSLEPPIRPTPIPTELLFPGWQILVGMEWFLNTKYRYKSIVESDQLDAWFNSSQIRKNYTNPMQIERFIGIFTDLLFEVSSVEKYLRVQLDLVFNTNVGDEFIDSRITPIKEHIKQLKSDCELQVSRGVQPYPSVNRVTSYPS
ncbi:hexosaminidase D-like [Chrysoperla carnea]|uniref:hexosaminidase D-like n=1 Tax=Chrysoperla carnea TaxID=189513 RepID=UPI001D06B3E8|nr:hexosaminidase D-like [Chrysoperla carnea]